VKRARGYMMHSPAMAGAKCEVCVSGAFCASHPASRSYPTVPYVLSWRVTVRDGDSLPRAGPDHGLLLRLDRRESRSRAAETATVGW
jgi:hypothetical protein